MDTMKLKSVMKTKGALLGFEKGEIVKVLEKRCKHCQGEFNTMITGVRAPFRVGYTDFSNLSEE